MEPTRVSMQQVKQSDSEGEFMIREEGHEYCLLDCVGGISFIVRISSRYV